MLEVHDLRVIRGSRPILGPISLSMATGEVTVIAGPNGAGKSTLIRSLAGEIKPSDGAVTLDGRPLSSFGAAGLAARRAVLPQASQLAFPFTVTEVVRLAFSGGGRRRTEIDAKVLAALREVDMEGFAHRFYQQLSGGEQQRVQLARVLCQLETAWEGGLPRYLLLDEPTSNLDVAHQLQVQRLARRRAEEGFGVVAILHDLTLAGLSADRLILMKEGVVAADGTPETVLTEPVLEKVYGVPMRILRAEGSVTPLPLPRALFGQAG